MTTTYSVYPLLDVFDFNALGMSALLVASLHSCVAGSNCLPFTWSSLFCLIPHRIHVGLFRQLSHTLEFGWGYWATLGMHSHGLQHLPPFLVTFENTVWDISGEICSVVAMKACFGCTQLLKQESCKVKQGGKSITRHFISHHGE